MQFGDENTFNLVRIDSSAQSLTRLGELSAAGPDIQLTPDGTTLVVVTTNGSVYRFSASDGSDIGSASISFPPDAVSEVNANTATALEYVGNVLYAAFDRSGPETDPGYLGTLNPVTGATTGIGLLTGMNAPAGGLAYYNSTMYAISAANWVFGESLF